MINQLSYNKKELILNTWKSTAKEYLEIEDLETEDSDIDGIDPYYICKSIGNMNISSSKILDDSDDD